MTSSLDSAWPDARQRQRKSAWTQHRDLVNATVGEMLTYQPDGPRRVGAFMIDASLVRAVASDIGHEVTHCARDDQGSWPLHPNRFHVAVVSIPSAAPNERLALITRAIRSIRAGGAIIVLATVVVAPRGDRQLVWSLSELIDALDHASGTALHLESLQSFRHPGEPFVRGALVAMTSLARPGDG